TWGVSHGLLTAVSSLLARLQAWKITNMERCCYRRRHKHEPKHRHRNLLLWICASLVLSAAAKYRASLRLVPEKASEARRRQFCIAHCVLNGFVPQVGLDRAGIHAIIRQLVAAGVAQHVRMDLHIEASSTSGAIDHRLETTL